MENPAMTCLLGGPAAVHVQLVCEGLLITVTRSDVTHETGDERRVVRLGNNPMLAEDRAFLQAVRDNDPSRLFSNYTDALRTHHLCVDAREQAQLT